MAVLRLACAVLLLAACSGPAGDFDAGVDAGGLADRAMQLCTRWKADRADLTEGTWSGSVSSCTPGDMTEAARANTVRVINLYRFIAGLPAVQNEASRDTRAQACALIQSANPQLSHMPPPSSACYSTSGAASASMSNICSGRAVECVDLYMSDFGNETTIGHRRWLLSNQLGPIGIGGTSTASCHDVIGGSGNAGAQWTAWPPAGLVPKQALDLVGLPSADTTGWTVQSYASAFNLTGASVTVSDQGANKPVTVSELAADYGSHYALRIVPNGWTSQVGHAYDVRVTGPSLATPIAYAVSVIDCP